MAHEIDQTTGRAAVFAVGRVLAVPKNFPY